MDGIAAHLRVDAHGFLPPTFTLEFRPNFDVPHTSIVAFDADTTAKLWGEHIPEEWTALLQALVEHEDVAFVDLLTEKDRPLFRAMLTVRNHADIPNCMRDLSKAALYATQSDFRVIVTGVIKNNTLQLTGSPGLFRMGWDSLRLRGCPSKAQLADLTPCGRRLFTTLLGDGHGGSKATLVEFPAWQSNFDRLVKGDVEKALIERLQRPRVAPERLSVDHPHLMPVIGYPDTVTFKDRAHLNVLLTETLGMHLEIV